jgi:hypothetical protein
MLKELNNQGIMQNSINLRYENLIKDVEGRVK